MGEYARTSETVYDWLAWYDFAPFLPHPEVSFYGSTPRLDSADAGSSYIGFETPRDVGFDDLAPIVFFAPATINEDTYAKVQVRSRGTSSNLSVVWATVDGILLYQYIAVPADEWVTVELQPVAAWAVEDSSVPTYETIRDAAPTEGFAVWVGPDYGTLHTGFDVSYIAVFGGPTYEGRLAIDTHDHPFHVVGTRDPAMPYELVIDTGTQRLVEIVAGEESLATHELVIDETGRAGDPWTHCGLFRPL